MWKLKLSDLGNNMFCNTQNHISRCFLLRRATQPLPCGQAVHGPASPPAPLMALQGSESFLGELQRNPSRVKVHNEERFLHCMYPSLHCDRGSTHVVQCSEVLRPQSNGNISFVQGLGDIAGL